jgi:hypothetical protein
MTILRFIFAWQCWCNTNVTTLNIKLNVASYVKLFCMNTTKVLNSSAIHFWYIYTIRCSWRVFGKLQCLFHKSYFRLDHTDSIWFVWAPVKDVNQIHYMLRYATWKKAFAQFLANNLFVGQQNIVNGWHPGVNIRS